MAARVDNDIEEEDFEQQSRLVKIISDLLKDYHGTGRVHISSSSHVFY